MLNNEGFIQRARPDVIEREREKLAALLASQAQLDERIGSLCS
jgi:valyl-tRNA synthetase